MYCEKFIILAMSLTVEEMGFKAWEEVVAEMQAAIDPVVTNYYYGSDNAKVIARARAKMVAASIDPWPLSLPTKKDLMRDLKSGIVPLGINLDQPLNRKDDLLGGLGHSIIITSENRGDVVKRNMDACRELNIRIFKFYKDSEDKFFDIATTTSVDQAIMVVDDLASSLKNMPESVGTVQAALQLGRYKNTIGMIAGMSFADYVSWKQKPPNTFESGMLKNAVILRDLMDKDIPNGQKGFSLTLLSMQKGRVVVDDLVGTKYWMLQ